MSDAITKVQAMVGCPHVWGTTTRTNYKQLRQVYRCGRCGAMAEWTLFGPEPPSAPDCTTLDGAIAAYVKMCELNHEANAKLGNVIVEACLHGDDMANAVCELTLVVVNG